MMKKEHTSSQLDNTTLNEVFDENPYIQWISKHGWTLLVALIVLTFTLMFIYRFSSGNSDKAEVDYFNAENDMALFQREASRNMAASEEAFDQLTAIIKRHPELQGKYEGLIAQTLINRNQFLEAKPYAEQTLKRVSADNLNNYHDYASATLLICENQNAEALKHSVELYRALLTDAQATLAHPEKPRNFGDVLFAMNLLRIAMLQQVLGMKQDELKSWQEWKQFAGISPEPTPSKGIHLEVFQKIIDHFAKGSISLINYIENREKALKSE